LGFALLGFARKPVFMAGFHFLALDTNVIALGQHPMLHNSLVPDE
jgi:hypothetical protein